MFSLPQGRVKPRAFPFGEINYWVQVSLGVNRLGSVALIEVDKSRQGF